MNTKCNLSGSSFIQGNQHCERSRLTRLQIALQQGYLIFLTCKCHKFNFANDAEPRLIRRTRKKIQKKPKRKTCNLLVFLIFHKLNLGKYAHTQKSSLSMAKLKFKEPLPNFKALGIPLNYSWNIRGFQRPG